MFILAAVPVRYSVNIEHIGPDRMPKTPGGSGGLYEFWRFADNCRVESFSTLVRKLVFREAFVGRLRFAVEQFAVLAGTPSKRPYLMLKLFPKHLYIWAIHT